jgi:hypothetical protein
MKNIWHLHSQFAKFAQASKKEQTKILAQAYDPDIINEYNYNWIINILIEELDVNEAVKLILYYLNNIDIKRFNRSNHIIKTIEILVKKKADLTKIRKILFNMNSKDAHKSILIMPNVTVLEEERALRAFSKNKYYLSVLTSIKFKPSIDALKKLPPVMRLNTLENLTSFDKLHYNIFEKIPSIEELENLLFGVALKYNSRVRELCEKYKDFSQLGQPGEITVTQNCRQCGDISLILKSNIIKSSSGFEKHTILGELVSKSKKCVICGSYGASDPVYKAKD